MSDTHHPAIRTFRPGDGSRLARAWTAAAPGDGITASRFRDLFLLDRNFEASGLLVAEAAGEVVGSAYAVRRRIAFDGDDLEQASGWIPYLFVVPGYRRAGVGRELLTRATAWLAERGATTAFFSPYTPNYFLPGLDEARYPEAARLFASAGFTTQYQAVAMTRSLDDYAMPDDIRARAEQLVGQGWAIGSPSDDDLVDLIELAGAHFNPDWGRAIREEAVRGLPLERIIAARDPHGTMLGWAMHGAYENAIDRFGPFGVLESSRGTGLGKLLLHLTLERMRAAGAHNAWFLWTDEESPAGHLYRKTGFTTTRTFSILRAALG